MKAGSDKVAKVAAVDMRSKTLLGRTALYIASGTATTIAMSWLKITSSSVIGYDCLRSVAIGSVGAAESPKVPEKRFPSQCK